MTHSFGRWCQRTLPLISYHSITFLFNLYIPLKMSYLSHDTLMLLSLSKSGARLGKFYMNPACLNSQLCLPTNEFFEHVDVLGLVDGVGESLKPFFNQIERGRHVTTTYAIQYYLSLGARLGMTISRVNRVTHPVPLLLGWVWDKLIGYGTGMGKLCKTRIGFGRVWVCSYPPRLGIRITNLPLNIIKYPKSPLYI